MIYNVFMKTQPCRVVILRKALIGRTEASGQTNSSVFRLSLLELMPLPCFFFIALFLCQLCHTPVVCYMRSDSEMLELFKKRHAVFQSFLTLCVSRHIFCHFFDTLLSDRWN